MTTPSELRDKLIEDFNDLVSELQHLRGAIRACDILIGDDEEEDDEEEDYEASHYTSE
jgi:hypothetical protein